MFFEREVNLERGELEHAEDNLKDTENRTGVLGVGRAGARPDCIGGVSCEHR